MAQQLRREGKLVNHKRVLRMMWESALLCRVKRRWVKTTDSNHGFTRYPNIIKGMAVTRLNQVWLSDITYIRIRTGFVYLAAILDAFSRRVIGYSISRALDTALTHVILRLSQFIAEVYNRKRLHSALGYLLPEDYEKSLPQYDNQAEASRTLLTISVQR